MKNNRGITLTSLIIYIIGMLIVIATIATLTSFFYRNVDINELERLSTEQFTEFSSIFSKEINKKNNKVIECKTNIEVIDGNDYKISYIIFSGGNQYTYKQESNTIYKNNIKVCTGIEDCDFSYKFINSIYQIKVNFKTANLNMTGENAVNYSMN
ncbi:MAG: hypothetical protein HFJ59_05175 [Clostridia bacterium]|nr:hypothetical protein [Clostridia bacterium]